MFVGLSTRSWLCHRIIAHRPYHELACLSVHRLRRMVGWGKSDIERCVYQARVWLRRFDVSYWSCNRHLDWHVACARRYCSLRACKDLMKVALTLLSSTAPSRLHVNKVQTFVELLWQYCIANRLRFYFIICSLLCIPYMIIIHHSRGMSSFATATMYLRHSLRYRQPATCSV
jgi:hypothetical protein